MGKIAGLLCGLLALLCLAPSAGARTVVDVFGRTVETPDTVQRLVALGSSMTFVTYMGAQDRAVGVEDLDKIFLTKPYIMVNRDVVRDVPVIGKAGAVRIPNYEALIRLRPDVIFIVSTERSEPDLIQRKTNIPVVAVGYGVMSYDKGMFLQSIELAGRVLDRTDHAKRLVDYVGEMERELARAPKSDPVTAYVGGLSYKGHQGIISTSANFMPMQLAGIRNVADATDMPGHLFINKEFLLNANPPLMFLDGNGMPLMRDGVNSDGAFYRRFKALREGNAYVLLPNTSYFINPEAMYANAFFMARIAHPQTFADLDPVAKADEIFTTFDGQPLYGMYTEHGYGFARARLVDGQLETSPFTLQ